MAALLASITSLFFGSRNAAHADGLNQILPEGLREPLSVNALSSTLDALMHDDS